MDNDILKINCTTHVVIKNKLTNKVYKDEQERDADINDPNTDTTADHIQQDLTVEVSPKGLEALKKVMSKNDKKS
jgi:predicted membrane GTPase involved in stress response